MHLCNICFVFEYIVLFFVALSHPSLRPLAHAPSLPDSYAGNVPFDFPRLASLAQPATLCFIQPAWSAPSGRDGRDGRAPRRTPSGRARPGLRRRHRRGGGSSRAVHRKTGKKRTVGPNVCDGVPCVPRVLDDVQGSLRQRL